MINKTNFLKMYRKQSSIPQQDIAYLLNIDSGNLSRYEKCQRQPTPEIILAYHILFEASLIDLFHQQYKLLIINLISRSKKLIEQLKIEQPPKRSKRIGYLENIINTLRLPKHE